MMEVVQQGDGQFAVRTIGRGDLGRVVALFSNQREADEWMLTQELADDVDSSGLNTLKPGGGQRLC